MSHRTIVRGLPDPNAVPLEIADLTICRRGLRLIDQLRLRLNPGEILTVTGVSGCGKTTLLRTIAGTAEATGGSVRRHPGLAQVFQEPRLLPWYSILQNLVLFAADPLTALFDAEDWLERVGLSDATELYPAQLSGCMRQRAAIARAMITRPRLLLVDEPFSALDRELAAGLRQQLLQIVTTEQIATVWVTHDLHEAELIGTSRLRLFGHPGDWTLA